MPTVDGSTRVTQVIDKMVQEHTGCVMVSVDGKVGGIFTERDVLKKVALEDRDMGRSPWPRS